MCPNQTYRFSLANLSRKGRKLRLVLGAAGMTATVGLAVFMILEDVHPLWRWSLLVPAFGSALCLFEAFASTCVVLAALGAWDLGCGTERVPDPRIDAALRGRAWKIVAVAAATAFLFTLATTLCVHSCP